MDKTKTDDDVVNNLNMNEFNSNDFTYSYDEYISHNNEDIISLNNELNDYKSLIRTIEQEIAIIQHNCKHEYMFVCRGMYKNNYTCRKCGHDTEH